MPQSAQTIANGAKSIYDGGAMKKMVFDPETGDFTMVDVSAPVQEGHVVDNFSKDGFAISE